MGATFAVAISQRVSNAVLSSFNCPPPSPFSSLLDSVLRKNATTSLSYIDDINIVGTSPMAVNSVRDHAAWSFASEHVPTKPAKNVDSGVGNYSIAIGLAWWRNRVITVKTSHDQKLFQNGQSNRCLTQIQPSRNATGD